jgi:hypothetical protein
LRAKLLCASNDASFQSIDNSLDSSSCRAEIEHEAQEELLRPRIAQRCAIAGAIHQESPSVCTERQEIPSLPAFAAQGADSRFEPLHRDSGATEHD